MTEKMQDYWFWLTDTMERRWDDFAGMVYFWPRWAQALFFFGPLGILAAMLLMWGLR